MQSPHGVTAEAYRPSVMGSNGMVASGHALASQAGIQTLMAGGNAVDAAIATAAALGVVEPAGSGVGGDGFILIYWAETGQVSAVNATGPAPGAATRERYLEEGGIPMKGMRSVSVPGLVDGWLLAHGRYGALPLAEVFRPAIAFCEDGFPVSHLLAEQLRAEHECFAADPFTRAVFSDDGEPIQAGNLLRNGNLGTTLREIARHGRKTLYEGEIARAIVEFSRDRDGLLTEEDLAGFHAHWAEPIHVNYRGYEVYEMPPNSSGHILLQELNIVELFDLQRLGCNSAQSIHLMVEAKKLAFADRENYMADPEWVDIPLEGMLSKSYAAEQAERIDPCHAAVRRRGRRTGSARRHDLFLYRGPGGQSGLYPAKHPVRIRLKPDRRRHRHPAQQPDDLLASRRGAPQLPDAGQARAPHDESCHRHQRRQAAADLRDPGADTQVQTNLQLLTNMLDFGMTPQEAVAAPRWRSLQNPMESTIPHVCSNNLQLEDRFPASVQEGLEQRGHELEMVGDWGGPGSAQAIMVHPDSGALIGGSDPRRDGYAVGY